MISGERSCLQVAGNGCQTCKTSRIRVAPAPAGDGVAALEQLLSPSDIALVSGDRCKLPKRGRGCHAPWRFGSAHELPPAGAVQKFPAFFVALAGERRKDLASHMRFASSQKRSPTESSVNVAAHVCRTARRPSRCRSVLPWPERARASGCLLTHSRYDEGPLTALPATIADHGSA
jgi:hypothetical protein